MACGERLEVFEVVRRQCLALQDREVDLDLVQPRGMYREVNLPGVGVGGLPSGRSTSCRHASCRCRRSRTPSWRTRRARCSSPARRGGRTGRSPAWARSGRTGGRGGRPMRPGRPACRRAGIELDQRRATRRGGHGVVAAGERVKLGLLIGADDVLARVRQPAPRTAARRGQEPGRPLAGSQGRAGRSTTAAATASKSGHAASARSSTPTRS